MRRKGKVSTYIIFALICLLVFNIGAILIKTVKIPTTNFAKTKVQQKAKIGQNDFFVNFFTSSSSIINLYKTKPVSKVVPDEKELDENDMEGNIDNLIDDVVIIDKLDEYEDLIKVDDSDGKALAKNVPEPLNLKPLKVDKDKPYILLYHTHGTESYSNLTTNVHHTQDLNYNVTTMGENISKVLEANGHNIKHVTKYHDIPSYNQSYSKSLNTATEELQKNNNFKILIDLHREGYDIENPSIKKSLNELLAKSTINIDGKDAATFFFVIGPDSENKDEVLNFAKYLKAVSDTLYPGLCSGIMVKPIGKFNQFLSDYSALIELGSNINTVEEATETSKIIGEVLSIALDKMQE